MAAKNHPGPKKGTRPDTTGVAGAICEIENLPLAFGVRARVSPYDALLRTLVETTEKAVAENRPRPGLRFDSPRCRPSLLVRARKLNLCISFAEHEGKLYVRFDGRTEEEVRQSRKQALLKLLSIHGPMTHVKCATKLRDDGDNAIDGSLANALLLQMVREGSLVQQDNSYFAVNPKHRAKAA